MRHIRVITKDISKKFAEKTLQESHFYIASLQLEPDLFKYLSFTDLPKENRRKGNKDKKKKISCLSSTSLHRKSSCAES